MQKLKNLKCFAMMLLMAMAGVSFTACGGDDDPDDDPIVNPDTPNDPSGGGSDDLKANLDKALVGQWVLVSSGEDEGYLVLRADGTGKRWYLCNGKLDEEYEIGHWETPSKGILTIVESDLQTGEKSSEKFQYAVSNDVLRLTYYEENGTTLSGDTEVFKRVN